METINLENDIQIMYVTASSFPAGIMDAHKKLHEHITYTPERKYWAVSRPEMVGVIVYRAGAEELEPGEGEKCGLETLTIKKGKYISTTVQDYMSIPQVIAQTFRQLLAQQGLDPRGYCVERYISKEDVQCMVRLED